ncbi:MAG: (Fe-S)-binding protein [Candidatus Kapabacteria bacterium]|nr:(Fe-S)-binding protein [Candidatus Kapabacteria bacterium]
MDYYLVKAVVFGIILVFSALVLSRKLYQLFSYLQVGKEINRSDNINSRIKNTVKVAFFQYRIFRDKSAGILHALIFWGFLTLLFSASESIFQGFYNGFSWSILKYFYSFITFSTDFFCVLVIVSIIFNLIRHFAIKVPRLQGKKEDMVDALVVLIFIFSIVCSLIIENAASTKIHNEYWEFKPIAAYFGTLIPSNSAVFIYEIFWWMHIILILAFANYLPYSKHLHVYTSIQNVFHAQLKPINGLERIDFEQEGVEKYGIVDVDDISRKSLFDGYSCTHCGRCSSVCPANTTGKLLDPREIIIQIRHRLQDIGPIKLRQIKTNGTEVILSDHESELLNKKFVGDYQSIEALWQCTTCAACMQECPIMIEHVPAIVGMRRSLVLTDAEFPSLLQSAFSNLENNGTPWAFSSSERSDWAEGSGIKTAAENPDFEYLFWVGCAGSFDDRAKKISLAFARLLQIAGVNFAILGNEEQCNGDVARRAGNEYLADMLIKANIETLSNYKVKKILTICPHCFNTFKNEYPDFGVQFEVIHHTQFLNNLIKSGKLKLRPNSSQSTNISYHDSCYLGRYNQIYDEPRNILKSISGFSLKEPLRNHDRGFCCGAGGAQMFLEETVGKRVNIERTEELINTHTETIALNCPFCMTMISDGIKAKDLTEKIQVKDLAEILLENVQLD